MCTCIIDPDGWSVELFSTPTTLCIPNTIFGYKETHQYTLEGDEVFSKKLENAMKNADLAFDVWALYYYPNVRDVLVAKVSQCARYFCPLSFSYITCVILVMCSGQPSMDGVMSAVP